jgi:hypothetical protein
LQESGADYGCPTDSSIVNTALDVENGSEYIWTVTVKFIGVTDTYFQRQKINGKYQL